MRPRSLRIIAAIAALAELNEDVLHLRTFAPVPRPEIFLKDLVVAQGDTVRVKKTVGD